MKVVIINGSGGCGKSTFIKLCDELTEYEKVYELSMVDYVKEIAKYIGWDGNKSDKGRRFLADIKDTICRYDPNIIYDSIDNRLKSKLYVDNFFGVKDSIFFINARSPEDINYLVKKYDAISLLIRNPRITQVTSNHADKGVYSYHYDYEIENDGTLEGFKEKAKKFLEELK